MHKNDGASVTYFMFQLRPLESFLEKKQHSSIMTKFINNLCLYLLHAVFSLVKPAISNTYLILMGFFQVFLQLHSSFKSKQQASHSSITPKFQGQCTSVQKGTRHRPCRFHFCKSNACQLAACFVPTAVAAYIVHIVLTSLHALYGRPAGLATRLNRKNISAKCHGQNQQQQQLILKSNLKKTAPS